MRKHHDNIEKLLLGAIILFVLLQWLTGSDLFLYIYRGLFAVLAGFYLFFSEKTIFRLLFAILIVGAIGSIMSLHSEAGVYLTYAGSSVYAFFGIFLIVKAIKESKEYANLELLTFLSGFFILIYPAYLIFAHREIGIAQFYNFALCFVLFTLMYNDNLWERYQPDEKKMLTFIVITALTEVLILSSRYI